MAHTLDKKEMTLMGNPKIKASSKWWRSMERYKKSDIGLRKIINHVKFLIDQRKLEKEYNLNPGETIGV